MSKWSKFPGLFLLLWGGFMTAQFKNEPFVAFFASIALIGLFLLLENMKQEIIAALKGKDSRQDKPEPSNRV